jgi:nucleoside-diphosphate-sugar epimerase
MTRSLILGAGPIGTELAARLVAEGSRVTVGTRSGTAPPDTTAVRLDASDPDALVAALTGHATVFLCTNPPYSEWEREWPPILDAVLGACARTGADLVMTGNLYGYGPVEGPMREETPLGSVEPKGRVRIRMWERALDAHRRGDVRVTEVRASDYFGPARAADAHLGTRFFAPLLASRTAWVVGSPTVRHSWAYLPDFAATLLAASRTDAAWGRAHLAPHSTDSPRADIAREVNALAGTHGRVRGIPSAVLSAAGLVSADLREVRRLTYQFDRDFVVDSTGTEALLGVRATPWPNALATTVDFYRGTAGQGARAARG